ncbi:biotin-dependent carboxyltransferase family protein [Aeromonas hydrophila]|uniref:5-oxoprolinase subunit C family protein n=1 Tax=Aeromonas hydrophila TaxID=644 RepID=UPI0022AEE367|nr:biotin-dependent carboxyltransferase family protein [Aeromonas hydrophila]MCZ4335685.1 biotin-dependent carboxyltransferase family protein [Aeromonas hydrophila]
MLEVLRPGALTTVQDLGREGSRHLGVAQCGALDRDALIVGNLLLGNPVEAAGLEITLGPVAVRFTRDTWFALTGADFQATLDGVPQWAGWSQRALAGQTLQLNGSLLGMRAYLTVAGGIEVPRVMGSRATDLKAGFGGLAGRALQLGDRLPVGEGASALARRGGGWRAWQPTIRVLPGPELAECDAVSQVRFWQQVWRVSPQSDRMGYRLQGEPMGFTRPQNLLSHAVLPGLIQLPPAGEPIILMADAQTTGGYPRIGCVVEPDLWKLAQARPGSLLHFISCDQAGARAARAERRHRLVRLTLALRGASPTPLQEALTPCESI